MDAHAAHDADELGLDALRDWLRSRVEMRGSLTASRISGGRSNLTYLLADGDGPRWVLRRPPFGHVLPGAHDVVREHRVVAALDGTGVPVPPAVGAETDDGVLGAPFAVTAFVPGHTLRTPDDAMAIAAEGRARLATTVADTLAGLHATDPEVTGVDPTRGHDYVARQLHVWQRQVDGAGGRDLPRLRAVGEALARHAPTQPAVAIVHGDYRLDNLRVSDAGEVRAILDWELWTLGDPLADLGAALCYWVEADDDLVPLGASPTTAPGMARRDELVERYAVASGRGLDDRDVAYHLAFGAWRFAAILEGVYQRNLAGAYGTTDEDDTSWRRFREVVPALVERAAEHLADAGR